MNANGPSFRPAVGPLPSDTPLGERGKWMALTAALLGWMFDGMEMGLFPLVARPALQDLLNVRDDATVGRWFSVATAAFLVGAATGGVLFGWLGDRIGRVRAMMLSVLTYAIFTGLCGMASTAQQVVLFRFIAALGMGGEWSLGVALVMEVWPNRSRGMLAGLIGAAANVGFLSIAVVSLGLTPLLERLGTSLRAMGLREDWVAALVGHSGWRLLMMFGAAPALLTFFIRLFVPESQRWQREQGRGTTSHWAARDLWGVVIGAMGPCLMIYLWAFEHALATRVLGTIGGLLLATVGYTYPVLRYLQRAESTISAPLHGLRPTLTRMLLGAALGGVALLGTWGSLQWAPLWADYLTGGRMPSAKAYTQIWSGVGAVIGTMAGALLGDWFGRRITYAALCAGSLVSVVLFYQLNTAFGTAFLLSVFLAGGLTASFYGWLPLYLPELFRTPVRATGQGFSFNFGRILAATGVLLTGNNMGSLQGWDPTQQPESFWMTLGNLIGLYKGGYPAACTVVSLIYVVGFLLIWFCPETKGKPLPE
jgi:MFS family permease